MKSLKTLQVLAKIGRILSKIIYICCLVGAIGCVVGIVSIAILPEDSFKLGGVSIHGLIEQSADMTMSMLYGTMVVGMLMAAAECVVSRFGELYFKNVLAAGTPFTVAGAKELKRLGILAIAVPYGTMLVSAIGWGIAQAFVPGLYDAAFRFSLDGSITLGALLIVGSVLCRAAAEQLGAVQDIALSDEEV